MRKIPINLIFSLMLVLTTIGFILADNHPASFVSGEVTSLEPQPPQNPEKSQTEKDCNKLGFCWNDKRCYSMGARLTIPPEYPNKEFSWRNETYLYCGQNSIKFVFQKITGATCENDFECQSNECNNNKCEQQNEIKIIEIYNDNTTLVENLIFQEKETFYFKGLNKNYSIGFGQNNSDFVFFVNNNSSSYENKTLFLDNNSQFIFNSIIFDGDITKANVTFIESKNPINDSKGIVEKKSTKEIPNEKTPAPITGATIGTERQNIFDKLLNFLRNIFRGNKN